MRRAFTLIELLAIVAIIGAMTTVGVVSILAGRQTAQVKAAARDVYAAIKNARSRAIVTGNRVIVNFANTSEEGENAIKIDVDSALVMNTSLDASKVQEYFVTDLKDLTARAEEASVTESKDGEGESVEDVLFSPMGTEVVRGMCLRFKRGENLDEYQTEAQRQSSISVYSTSDYWIEKYAAAKGVTNSVAPTAAKDEKTGEASLNLAGTDESGTVVWETNGSVDPHRVWVYPEGQDPATGLVLVVDRFGGIKICNADGSDEEDD